jgi:hypothetical protein
MGKSSARNVRDGATFARLRTTAFADASYVRRSCVVRVQVTPDILEYSDTEM